MRAVRLGRVLRAVALLGVALPVEAHGTGAVHDELPGWTLDPWITVPLVVSAALFIAGWLRLRARTRRNVGRLNKRMGLFAGGWLILAIALASPLHQEGERSFAAHMFEHELIMLAAAPLLVLSEPLVILLWALPLSGRRASGAISQLSPVTTSWKWLTAPVPATVLQAAALWLWHAPALFDLALANEGWHAAQHLSFLVSALLFWTAMLSRRTAPALAALCLVATSIVIGALGAFMAFATSPWYRGYARLGMAPLGLTPAEDQQLAGLLMWIPGGLVHAGAALAMMRRLLRNAHA